MELTDPEKILLKHRIQASIEIIGSDNLKGEAFSLLGGQIEIRREWGTFCGKTRRGWEWYVAEPRAIKEFRKGFDVASEYVIKHIIQTMDDMHSEQKPSIYDRWNWDYI